MFHSTVYDEANHRLIVYGGLDASVYLDDIWVLEIEGESPAVSHVDPGPAPTIPGPEVRDMVAFVSAPSPNPSPRAVEFTVQAREDAPVQVVIYDALGRKVSTLHDGRLAAGKHRFSWDSSAVSGAYFVALESGEGRKVSKFVIVH
jgi:hypothetical protein